MSFLQQILAHKEKETVRRMQHSPLQAMSRLAAAALPPKPFINALVGAADNGRFPVIAEIKRRSPSKGILCQHFNPAQIAQAYRQGRAACLSVLTDEQFFGGCADDLSAAVGDLPILRKDFMLNEWQIVESRAMGADAILLIVAALTPDKLHQMASVASDWGMAVLIEAHNQMEMEAALAVPDTLIGINNRNLETFETDLQTTLDLLPIARRYDAERLIISESGIHDRQDIERLQQAGVDAYLIGESLMRQPTTGLQQLFAV